MFYRRDIIPCGVRRRCLALPVTNPISSEPSCPPRAPCAHTSRCCASCHVTPPIPCCVAKCCVKCPETCENGKKYSWVCFGLHFRLVAMSCWARLLSTSARASLLLLLGSVLFSCSSLSDTVPVSFGRSSLISD